MKNTKLRNYLFETIREQKTIEWIILRNYYNNPNINNQLPKELIIKSLENLLQSIMETEWIKWTDVIYNSNNNKNN